MPSSFLPGVIPHEAELTAGVRIEPGKRYGFFTDTTLCIGCKACEVACKEWNLLPADDLKLRGHSYDNTGDLGATTWRHVHFIEHMDNAQGARVTEMAPFQSNWLMMSDVCKHCSPAPVPGSLPDRRAVPHRVRHGRRAAGHLQRLRLLRAGLPVRRRRGRARRRQGAQMHAVLRPAEGRARAGLRQILPDRLDPVRRIVRPARARPPAGRPHCTNRA